MNQGMAVEQMLKPMKALRKDILKLIQIYIETEDNFEIFNQNFLPTFQTMVSDYQQSDPNARDPEILMLFAVLMKKEGQYLSGFLNQILFSLCASTLEVI